MDVCLYFQVHQPLRLLEYTFFQIGKNHSYEHSELNEKILSRIADNCYLPTNTILLKLIKANPESFKVAFSISGILLEQFKIFRPDVLKSFKELAQTGCVEFLAETYYHSLSFLYDKDEFDYQVQKHAAAIEEYFAIKPTTFRNTELIYSNELAQHVEKLGYLGIITEGVGRILKTHSPHQLFNSKGTQKIATLVRDFELSDDIAYRFSDKNSKDYPLTAKKYTQKLIKLQNQAEVVNVFIDYETFGEHHREETGIFKFLEKFPVEMIANGVEFKTPSEIIKKYKPKNTYDVPDYISWADTERDLSAWLGNSMQYESLSKIYEMKDEVLSTGNEEIITTWRKLQTSDHFYYMSTKYMSDGEVHAYFSPFNSPYDAYIFYMNVLSDFEITLKKAPKVKK